MADPMFHTPQRTGCGCIICQLRETPAWRRWLYFKTGRRWLVAKGKGLA